MSYSDHLTLGPDNLVQILYRVRASQIAIHCLSLRRNSSYGLQAFKVIDNSMERIIAKNSTVIVDLTDNDPKNIIDGHICMACTEIDTRQCTFRHLRPIDRLDNCFLISPENQQYKSIVRRFKDFMILGRVITIHQYF
ncbi:MAG: S24 family peptidase [Deltaproteobacteria bacterium]|nr:S24 family peptidase [Deltaproteobacteria bacterium]